MQKKMKQSKKIIIPHKFLQFDAIRKYGGKIEDPFALNTENNGESRVFTHEEH